jgi:periplasmic divalent cation tolerance protein
LKKTSRTPGSDLRVVLVTAPPRSARALAKRLVEKRLAACVNLIPGVRSIYRWEGRVEESRETLLVLKTTAGALKELESAVKELHPYDVPEFVVLPVERASEAYANWVRDHSPRVKARFRSRSFR